MQNTTAEPRRPFETVRYGDGRREARIDSDDLAELRYIGLPPAAWYLAQGQVTAVLPDGKPIAIARLITEAPAGMRVCHKSRDPGELRRFTLHLRPFKPAKQCGKAAKDRLRELADFNRRMQARACIDLRGHMEAHL